MKDTHTYSGTDGHVGKFHCNVPAANKSNLGRELVQFQELRAVDEVFFPRNSETRRFCASGDNNEPSGKPLSCNFK